ncbi:hypothetical protein DSM07_07405 [Oenococcus sp. UCMA 16435]|nr:hypothetical protein DSM07_07405 [Oenococcus sp. UCMA 16435]
MKRVRFSGFKKVNNKLDYNQSVQKVKFQISAVKSTKVMKNFGKSPAIITKSSKNLDNKIPGYSVMIEPIKDSLNTPQSREGTFFIETKNKQKIHQFLILLAQRLSEREKKAFDQTDFKIRDSGSIAEVSFNDPEQLNQLVNILLIFLIIFLIMFQLSNSKQLSVYRLNGISTVRSFVLSLGGTWLVSIAITIFIDFVCWYFLQWRLGLGILIKQIAIFIAIPLISFTIIDLLQSLSFTNRINNKNYNKFNFIFLYAVKGISIILCFFSLNPLVQLFIGAYSSVSASKGNYNQNRYAVFYPAETGNDAAQHTWMMAKF